MPPCPTLLGSVPCSPAALFFSEGISRSPPFIAGASPVVDIFSVHEVSDGPCSEPLPRQGVATCWARISHRPPGA